MSGRRAALRSWKSYYTVLCGQILCFFKDAHDFKESKAASPPLLIHKVNTFLVFSNSVKIYLDVLNTILMWLTLILGDC